MVYDYKQLAKSLFENALIKVIAIQLFPTSKKQRLKSYPPQRSVSYILRVQTTRTRGLMEDGTVWYSYVWNGIIRSVLMMYVSVDVDLIAS